MRTLYYTNFQRMILAVLSATQEVARKAEKFRPDRDSNPDLCHAEPVELSGRYMGMAGSVGDGYTYIYIEFH